MLKETPLGKIVSYKDQYDPSLLVAIPRSENRSNLKWQTFNGIDLWMAYELSWLNPKGKPEVAIGEIEIPASSPYLIESKSMKLYFNSLNQTSFPGRQQVAETIAHDLSKCCNAAVSVSLHGLEPQPLGRFGGICLDSLDVTIDTYEPDPTLLRAGGLKTQETVYTDLFRSNCLITGQPDWASISIYYDGPQINHPSLLKYLISYRNHRGFHEHCTEQIFSDLMEYCDLEQLQVYARFTRRGGVDINCYRTTDGTKPGATRLARQ